LYTRSPARNKAFLQAKEHIGEKCDKLLSNLSQQITPGVTYAHRVTEVRSGETDPSRYIRVQ